VADLRSLPLLSHDVDEPAVFSPKNLLEAARRQKRLQKKGVPGGCVLDFDGELVEHLAATGRGRPDRAWPCFHTRLYRWRSGGSEFGIIGGTVGAPFAVLVAEELFASGCCALVSIGSAGRVASNLQPPFFVLIERALRDEGTSYHYLPPSTFVEADAPLLDQVQARLRRLRITVLRASTWTTDAPFRETASRIALYRRKGIVAVEMEAAALLALAAAHKRRVLCLSHVTNEMARAENDFEKGGEAGQERAIRLCEESLRAMLAMPE